MRIKKGRKEMFNLIGFKLMSRKVCPLVKKPFDSCYYANLNSENIVEAIYYCGKHFEECKMFTDHEKRKFLNEALFLTH